MFKKLRQFYYKQNSLSFVLLNYLLFVVLLPVPYYLLSVFFEIDKGVINKGTEDMSVLNLLIVTVIIAPLFETLFFQYGIIKILTYINPKTKYIAIFLSALLFSLIHWFGITYIIYTFLMGIFFGFLYFTTLKKGLIPYWVIVLIHSLYNLTVFIFNGYILK